ncbi:bifunctional diaminohydroxyphosphoribosylaminopyrimidine deaminase/5-amino-6-(5-phosphoribosylamino)uracil reductase RibD [Candidatus Pelagibacter sp.]|nr:bifunctional diaminohydroxyphosphoribosylaminopyrimidine deaminase/5-amino-6-(5-phosphoribosylamino)uracil reductase RibD [Candidatus Pelagibacter sp.]
MSTRKDNFTKKDIRYMSLALNLARARHGLTGINPSVGCVIVKNDEIISIGQTGYGGTPHAEYNAIKNSNVNLTGSKMYVTLEPCNHYGKTPPCTNLIIKKKLKEVFYSVEDIDKKVKGKSLKILKSKKIIIRKNLLKHDVLDFYKPYFFNRINKIPYVTGKIAISKNNLIYSEGTKRITDIYSDKITHFLRFKNDSLMISYKTLNKDNPKLDCRLNGLNKFSPKRIILDKSLQMNTNTYIFKTASNNNTIVFYNKADNAKILKFKRKGIQLIKSNLLKDSSFDMNLIFKKLYRLGSRNLLIEGGNVLSKNIIKKKLFNQFYLFKSPKNLSKLVSYKDFNFFKDLLLKYKRKKRISTQLGKDTITLYKL